MIEQFKLLCSLLVLLQLPSLALGQRATSNSGGSRVDPTVVKFMESFCVECHNRDTREGGLSIAELLEVSLDQHSKPWESIVRKLAARQMPPVGNARPNDQEYNESIAWLVNKLDHAATIKPNPGRTDSFRRLTQSEYQFAIRDLLNLDIDASEMIPADESSHGFDNITVTGLSPVLLDRYVTAAQKISRLAIGVRIEPAAEKTYRLPPDVTQDVHLPGTPIGTRGGTVVRHTFPQDGEYEIQAWLMRDRNEELEGMRGEHQLDFLVDRALAKSFKIAPPPRGQSDKVVDANLIARVPITAGPHDIAIVFAKNSTSLLESAREPLNVHFNFYRHPRIEPAIYQMTIRGPFNGKSGGDTPSRQRIFISYPKTAEEEIQCAEKNLLHLMRRAYRRNVSKEDLNSPMAFYREGSANGGFEVGMERAICSILVNPQFLFRIEREPTEIAPQTAYKLTPIELASRLSFFLWNSIPDDELMDLAISGQLQDPEVFESQVRRLLADKKADSMIRNFVGQWLYLRNLDSVKPDMRLYPDFDDNLRQALRTETELFFNSIVREDRSVLDLIKADYTFLNERLAKHYEVEHVYGSHFRRVALDEASRRGGLLRQGSILTVTSYATRTSPVIRGHWVLKNLLGSPPPPPPPDVPALEDNIVAASLSVRQRLQKHRENQACAVCHNLLDPVGFSLENFDAIGRWRETENGNPLDISGGLPGGDEFSGVAGLEQGLLKRPELFVQTLTEKLMTFALGRGIEHFDSPAVREVVRQSQPSNYRFSDIILQITKSFPFQMRNSQ